jgi:tetratricopeptide (TPR) repeat protein
VYQKLLAIAPKSVWAYHHLADIFKQQQRYQAAIEAYRKELYLNPESYWSYIHLGELLIKTHQSQEAITVYQQVIEKQPDFLAAYYNLGKVCLQEEKWQDAVTAYHKATELDPDSFWAYQCLARALYRQGKALMQQPQNDALLLHKNSWNQSIDAYLKAIKLKPDLSSWYYEQEFWSLAQYQNQLDHVIEIYRQLIQQNPDLVNCHINLGKALSLQGKKAEAMTCYRAAGRQITFAKYTRLQNQSNLKLIPVQSPDFIIIGAQKCGTTSLYHYLAQHPNIICSIIKETDFWLNDFHQGLEWYLAQFPPRLQGEKILIGEASPNYLNERDVPERLFQVFPNVKLIVLLRNPVNRAISHYYHSLRGGWTSCPLPEAIETEIQKLQNQEQDYWNQPNGYVARGVYIEFLKKWMTIFPKEQFLILRSEDFYAQPESTLMQVFDFLNLPPASEMNLKPYNQGFYQPIPIKLRQKIHTFFQPYNQQLEAFFRDELSLEFRLELTK